MLSINLEKVVIISPSLLSSFFPFLQDHNYTTLMTLFIFSYVPLNYIIAIFWGGGAVLGLNSGTHICQAGP